MRHELRGPDGRFASRPPQEPSTAARTRETPPRALDGRFVSQSYVATLAEQESAFHGKEARIGKTFDTLRDCLRTVEGIANGELNSFMASAFSRIVARPQGRRWALVVWYNGLAAGESP